MPRRETPNLPLVIGEPAPRASRSPWADRAGAAALEAQAQTRRGLRDESAVDRARRAYLGAQWSGDHDRRPEPGLLTRTRL